MGRPDLKQAIAGGARMRRTLRLGGWALGLLAGAVQAQVPPQLPPATDPGALQRRSLEIERRIIDEQQRRNQPATPQQPVDTDALTRPAAAPADDALRFRLKEVEFTPSQILKPEELQAIVAPYRDREVSFADLRKIVAAINALYRERGIVTAQAVIPPQQIDDGRVRIRLVEGRIGSYRIEGNDSTRESYVLDRLHQPPGALFRLDELENDLVRFNRTNDVQARAELLPGAEFGTTDVLVRLAEPPRQSVRVFTDNSGAETTGLYRVGAIYQNRSLLGFRDELTLTATAADGYRGYGINYAVPWNTWGGRAQLGYFFDTTDIVGGPFASLGLNGESRAVIGAIRQPVHTTVAGQLDLVVGGKWRDTENYADSVFLQQTDTRDGSLGLDGSLADSGGVTSGNLYAIRGNYDITGGYSGDYSIARGALRRFQSLPEDWSLRGSGIFQYTGDAFLPSSEQFFVGGDGAVRGYSNGLYGGNRGYVLSGELHRPLWGGNPELADGTGVSGFLYTDYGTTQPPRPSGSTLGSITLWSAGGGVLFSYSRWLSGRLTLAYLIKDRPEEDSRLKLLFTIVATAF